MRPQELNLIMIFDAIMTEGSITRAADRLSITQPAVSNALSRMRVAWKDELFVKDGRGIQPTVFAQNIWSQIRDPLRKLENAIDPGTFEPATANRTFRISIKDLFVDLTWLTLRKIVETEAPNINFHAIPNTLVNNEQLLNDAEVDMVIGAPLVMSNVIRSQHLLTPRFVCVMRHDHPLATKEFGIKEYLQAEHLLISVSGDTTGVVEPVLAQMGVSRRIAMTVNHYSAVVPLIKGSNLIATVPSMGIERAIINHELVVYQPPVEIPPVQVSLLWHKRQDNDAGLIWLRNHVTSIIKEKVEAHIRALDKCCRKCPLVEQVEPDLKLVHGLER